MFALLATLVATTWTAASAQDAGIGCGGIVTNAYGPYDYRKDKDRLTVVESYHFTAKVEALIAGQSDYIGGDLDYTLRAFPNHHRALLSLTRFGERLKTDNVPYTKWTVRCYYLRALAFKPDDTTVRMLYATYLHRRQLKDEALKQLEVAKSMAENAPFTQYNIGLIYADIGEYEQALEQAHIAMALGFTNPELKTRLQAVNRWAEPASAPR